MEAMMVQQLTPHQLHVSNSRGLSVGMEAMMVQQLNSPACRVTTEHQQHVSYHRGLWVVMEAMMVQKLPSTSSMFPIAEDCGW